MTETKHVLLIANNQCEGITVKNVTDDVLIHVNLFASKECAGGVNLMRHPSFFFFFLLMWKKLFGFSSFPSPSGRSHTSYGGQEGAAAA